MQLTQQEKILFALKHCDLVTSDWLGKSVNEPQSALQTHLHKPLNEVVRDASVIMRPVTPPTGRFAVNASRGIKGLQENEERTRDVQKVTAL